jgi:hypothetical protein
MLNVTPIVFSSSYNRFFPLQKNGNVYSFFRPGEVVSEVETLGDVLDRLNIQDGYNFDRSQLVGKVEEYEQPSHFHCGGVVHFWIGLVKQAVNRFDAKGMSGILVSLDNGVLQTRIPG